METRNTETCSIKSLSSDVAFEKKDTICVLQHEYAVTQSDSIKPILGTWGASPCVILAVYDKKNKIALLSHIDADANVDSLQKIIEKMDVQETTAYIYGGNEEDPYKFNEVKRFVEKNQLTLLNATLTEKSPHEPASLAIDARTGAIFTPVRAMQLNVDESVKKRISEFNENMHARADIATKKSHQVITQNKQFWDDRKKMTELLYQSSLFPLEEAYNGLSFTHTVNITQYFSQLKNYFFKPTLPLDKEPKSNDKIQYKK